MLFKEYRNFTYKSTFVYLLKLLGTYYVCTFLSNFIQNNFQEKNVITFTRNSVVKKFPNNFVYGIF